MLRTWSIGVLTLSGLAVAAGCGVSASTTGLTPAFAEAAGDAHRYMTEHLLAAMGTSQFPRALAESRARVKTVRSKVSNDADKNLWLVLAMINVKSNEARSMYDLRNYMDRAPQVVTRVIGRATAYVATGLVLGLTAAWGLSQFVSAFLFQVDGRAPAIYVTAAIVTMLSGVAAAAVPARRAARVDPLDALRAG